MSDHFVAIEGDETISKYVVDIETSLANEGGEHEAALSLLKPFDRRREPSEWDLRFTGEDKCVHWCKETFYEESIVQISFSFLGPLCWPWAIKLCGIDGMIDNFTLEALANHMPCCLRSSGYANFSHFSISK